MKPGDNRLVDNLMAENAELRARLEEAEQALLAVKEGEADRDLIIHLQEQRQQLITARKQAEEALRVSEQFNNALLDTTGSLIVVLDMEGRIQRFNHACEATTGYAAADVLNRVFWELMVPKEELEGVRLTWERLQAGDFPNSHENHWIAKDNSRRLIEWTNTAIVRSGKMMYIVGAGIDITDRKLAEAALQESELRFRTMANAMPQLAWIAQADGHICWYNQRWYDYTGKSFEQMEGWGWQSVHDPKELPKVLVRWQASLATGQPFDMTFPLRGADGVFRPFLTRVIPLKDTAGRVLQWFGTNTDISELKRAEQMLRESESLYRSIGESIDYGVWVCAPDGRNIYASKSFLDMVGITQEQCSNFGWGNVLHPDDAERTIKAWQECVRTGGLWDVEHRFRGADGQWHHVLARGVPVRNEQGEIISWAGINLDIRRIKQAEEQTKTSLAEKEVLIKEIHHRVKNNFQIISSLISLQADALGDDQLKSVLDDVCKRIRTMALVHEKLYQADDLARLDFAEYAASLLKHIWSTHGIGNVRLKMSLAPLILPVEMAVHCGLILNELSNNIIKHAYPNGGNGEVTVTLEHDPATRAVCLCVRDNGVGLPEDLDFRKPKSLGLRLVQMLAGNLHGMVQTGSGPGAEFQINFKL